MTSQSPLESGMYRGDFATWAEAEARGTPSRESASDLRAKLAARRDLYVQVRDRKIAFVRDGAVFDQVPRPHALLAHLLRIGLENDSTLRIVDFGGSFGTTYFQCRDFLRGMRKIRWTVVEKPEIAAAANEVLVDGVLSFQDDLADALAAHAPDVVLCSGVLQNLQDPESAIALICSSCAQNVLIDRTTLIEADASRIALQFMPAPLGEVSWPVRLFARSQLLGAFAPGFEVDDEFSSYCDPPESIDGLSIEYRGFSLRRS